MSEKKKDLTPEDIKKLCKQVDREIDQLIKTGFIEWYAKNGRRTE